MNSKLEKLEAFIRSVKSYKDLNVSKDLATRINSFAPFIENIHEAKSQVKDPRLKEALDLFNVNKNSIKISSFELMQYNFHENTHTNVLQYLLDYRFSGDLGQKILQSLLEKIDNLKADNIASSINYNYNTKRESSIGIGRIDLLIVSDKAKFVIMIENKILANISQKEDDEDDDENEEGEKKVTRTQLTNYKEYINKEYGNYNRLFILLSYKKQNTTDVDYVSLDYTFLLEVLQSCNENNNNILNEYILLLKSIIDGKEDNIDALELGYSLVNNQENASLNEIEQLKKYYNAK